MDSSGELKCMLFDNSAPKIVNQTVDEILDGVYDEVMILKIVCFSIFKIYYLLELFNYLTTVFFKQIQDPTNVPDCLKSLVGKTFQFLINIDKDNIHGGNDTYKVSYVELGDDAENVDPPEDSDVPIDHNSLISVERVNLVNTYFKTHIVIMCSLMHYYVILYINYFIGSSCYI